MPCTACGAENPGFANYCMQCGASLRWEHRDLIIQLGLTTRDLPPESETRRRFDDLVGEALEAVAREGWEPVGPADSRALLAESRLRWRGHAGVGGHYLLDSIVVRVRRPQPALTESPRPAA
jgi:hypothetical protein